MVVRYEAINRTVTEKLMKYIGKGYIIRTQAMGGSQGEIANIDLTNGKETIRIIVERNYHICRDENDFYYDEVVVKIMRADAEEASYTDEGITGYSTIWNNHCEVVEEIKFYELRSNVYETDYEAFINCRTKHRERYAVVSETRRTERTKEFELTDRVKGYALRAIKNRKGYKRTKAEDITSVRKSNGKYLIGVNAKVASIG